MYSREWNRDVTFGGRVRVQLKQEDGTLCSDKFASRECLFVKGRSNDLWLKLVKREAMQLVLPSTALLFKMILLSDPCLKVLHYGPSLTMPSYMLHIPVCGCNTFV
jgi:hypothetical protein